MVLGLYNGAFKSGDFASFDQVTTPDFVRHIGSDAKGFAAYLESRFHDDTIAVAGQMRLAIEPGVTKLMAGVVGKGYLESLHTLLLGEAHLVLGYIVARGGYFDFGHGRCDLQRDRGHVIALACFERKVRGDPGGESC